MLCKACFDREKVATWHICPAKGLENAEIRLEKGFLSRILVSYGLFFAFSVLHFVFGVFWSLRNFFEW